jgi:PAS domain S-box-containing protein
VGMKETRRTVRESQSPSAIDGEPGRPPEEGELRYLRLLEGLLDGFALSEVVLDEAGQPVDFVFLAVNEAFEGLTGLTAEVIGRRVTEVVPQLMDSPDGLIGKAAEVALTGRPERFERYVEPLHRWLAFSMYQAAPGQVATVFEDVSEREELSHAQQKLDAHMDNSPAAVIEFDPEFRVIRWAASAERVFGYTAAEVLGKRIADMHWVYEEDAALEEGESAGLLDGSKARSVNVNRNYRKDDSVIWCEWYSSAIHDNEGRLVSVLSLVLDITERRRAEDQARRELENTRLLLEAAHAMTSARSLRDVCDAVCDAVLQAVPRTRVTVSLWDERRRLVETAASKGESAVPVGEAIRVEELSGSGRRIIESRESALIDYDALASAAAVREGRVPSHVAFGVPLVYRDRLVGLLTIGDPVTHREFTEREIEIVEGIASQASVAMENARLYDSERERARLTDALSVVELSVHASLEWPEIARRALAEAAAAIGADTGAILGQEGPEWVVWNSYGFDPPTEGARFREDRALRDILEAARSETVVIDDALAAPQLSGLVAPYGVKSLIVAPLVARGTTSALLVLSYRDGVHHFSQNESRFVTRVASGLSLALENARVYGAERLISDRLQEALLAMPDSVPGLDFAHAYHSASETTRVGGDFYDLFEIGDDAVGITIGDVAGKGLDASALTSLVKNTIRAHAMEVGKTPAQILALANEVVYEATPAESFVTVFFGRLSRRDGRLEYANGGHTTCAVVRGEGRSTGLDATGPLLGAFRDADFRDARGDVACDDLLFLYTDGLTEARRDAEQYGEARLFDLLARISGSSPLEFVHTVLEEVLAYTGHDLSDDLALLVVKRCASGGEGSSGEASRA